MSNFDVIQFVSSQVDLFKGSVSDDSMSWQQESQFAIQAFQKNDFLAKTAMGNPQSAQNAIINVAAIGITLNPAAKLAYLVPRDRGVHLDISYMGLLHIAQSTGSILWGQCKLVYSNDTYESNGLDVAPTHKYNAFGNRGDVIGGYCTVKTCDGDYLTDEMSLADIKKVQATSKASNGPWKTFWEEMARKTIVKRASKYWPKIDRLDKAINYLNTDAGEGIQDEGEKVVEHIIDVDAHIASLALQQGRTDAQLFEWLSKSYKREIQCFDDMTEDEKQFVARKLEGKA
jgi:recombination protein RecT